MVCNLSLLLPLAGLLSWSKLSEGYPVINQLLCMLDDPQQHQPPLQNEADPSQPASTSLIIPYAACNTLHPSTASNRTSWSSFKLSKCQACQFWLEPICHIAQGVLAISCRRLLACIIKQICSWPGDVTMESVWEGGRLAGCSKVFCKQPAPLVETFCFQRVGPSFACFLWISNQ